MPEYRGSKLNINNSSGFVRLRSKFSRLGGRIVCEAAEALYKLIKEGHNIDHEFHFIWTAYGPVYVMLGVMCDAYTPDGEPISTNKRCAAVKIFSKQSGSREGGSMVRLCPGS
ncbi:putative glutamine synthetase [Helianthus annuus]|nr:putative glutamine synthetase [Helianthus annuus]KAJ0541238.1 putative glutamine synthetase [Helianthus annuus]KAJ0706320.1 putative glutamine synthetase [Helianthus annuus]KAJ0710369.1 putative glutamine synthetase [Helianthus annuus]KAJ0886831.1 putative glutamine synthetase [Helianthus annuus]